MNVQERLYHNCLTQRDYGRVQINISPEVYLIYKSLSQEERNRIKDAHVELLERDILLLKAGYIV